jgi:ABC transporter with metal-binding/Fe-S-binding domain ATP-binding protein
MRLGVLFSGGKDSAFACNLAGMRDEVVCLITIASGNKESYMFHTPNVNLARLQADACEIPLIEYETAGEKESELADLKAAIAEAKRTYDIAGVVSGAIMSVYQASRVQRICYELDLFCFNPLWYTDQREYMNKIIAGGFEILISGVFAYPLDEKLLGARVDERFMAALDRIAAKYKITLTGEGGEFETFTADAPFYKKRIVVDRASASCRNNNGLYTILEAHLEDKPPIAPKADADAEDDADNADVDSAGDTHTVLICNLCSPKYPLSVAEYVKPVENIVKAAGFGFKTLHFTEVDAALTRGDLPDISAIILCGTALKDNGFADSMGDAGNADKFRFIRDASGKDIPILGIGSGFRVLAKIAGGDVIGERDLRIGMTKAKVVKTTGTAEKIFENRENFEVYELHKNAVTLPDCFEALAVADDDGRVLAAKHRDKEIYGVLFHPEVRNEYIVENFLKKVRD